LKSGGRASFQKHLGLRSNCAHFALVRVVIFISKFWRNKNEEDRIPAAGSGHDAGAGGLRRIQAR
jgi:hypothetical protein